MDRIAPEIDEYHLLERIYASCLDSDLWPSTLSDLEHALGGNVLLLEFDRLNRHTGRYCDHEKATAFLSKLKVAKVGTGRSVLDFLLSQAADGGPLNQYDFGTFATVGAAKHISDQTVTATVLQTGAAKVLLACEWNEVGSANKGTQKSLMKRLSRHLVNALEQSNKLRKAESRAAVLETMVRHQPVPSVLLDTSLTILSVTPACDPYFKSEVLFCRKGERLVATQKDLEKALNAAIQDIEGALRPLPEYASSNLNWNTERSVICGYGQKQTLRVIVRSVVQDAEILSMYPSGLIHLQVREPTTIPVETKEYLETKFTLSNSEARLAYHLAVSGSFAETLELLNITRNTGKTHLRRIYEKTGAQSQAELCTLISALGRMF